MLDQFGIDVIVNMCSATESVSSGRVCIPNVAVA
jgi:hypothetical protein